MPIGPLQSLAVGLGSALDVTLDPQFAANRRIYIAYAKPGTGGGNDATTAVYRAKWDGGSTLTEGKDIWVADAYHGAPGTEKLPGVLGPATGSYGTRFAWDPAGNLFVSLGDRNIGVKAQDPNSHIGKIVRITTDGSVPKDNPFVGRAGYKPEIWTLGHRNPLGLYVNPIDGTLWSTEEGPQGGDELNQIVKGKNYGWPEVSLGRNYDGTVVGKGFTAPGYEEPIVYWVPAIAISGLSFYDGDKFPQWKGNAFVGAMRGNTGQHVQRVQFNPKGLPTGREIFLGELKQRIRAKMKPEPRRVFAACAHRPETFGAVAENRAGDVGSRACQAGPEVCLTVSHQVQEAGSQQESEVNRSATTRTRPLRTRRHFDAAGQGAHHEDVLRVASIRQRELRRHRKRARPPGADHRVTDATAPGPATPGASRPTWLRPDRDRRPLRARPPV
jgi:glucose/arabinose dehydrogenase